MDSKPNPLYTLASLTSILSGLLMVVSSCLFIFNVIPDFSASAESQVDQRTGILHGIGVVTLILIVPTVAANYTLLRSETRGRSLLGALFAMLWILMELAAHCSLTAPLRSLSELLVNPETEAFGRAFSAIWEEWGEALFMTGSFLSVLMALCYGLAFHSWGNPPAAALFLICAIAFPVGVWLLGGIQLHVLLRGCAFIFMGGVLLRAARETETDSLDSVNYFDV